MDKHGGLACRLCGGKLNLLVTNDGADFLSELGKGSNFNCAVELFCVDCGMVYPIARCKRINDVCDVAQPNIKEKKNVKKGVKQ